MKDAYYFSHDSNAKDDPKCVLLIEQLGLEGYGIFWVLIEILRDQQEYKYPMNLIPSIARKYNTSTEKVKTVILNYDLFNIENEQFFYSNSLLNRMNKYELKCAGARKAGQISAEKRKLMLNSTNVEQTLNKRKTTVQPNKVKESKVKESKIKDFETRKNEFINSLSEFKQQYSTDLLNSFYRYWSEKNTKKDTMRFEDQKYFEISKRLSTWKRNSEKNEI